MTRDPAQGRSLTRRQFVGIGAAGAGAAIAAAYGFDRFSGGGSGSASGLASSAAAGPVDHVLRAEALTAELGGPVARTWGYSGGIAGPELRLRRGAPVRVRLDNALPDPTTVHWHGIRLPNAMDGVPGMTQAAVEPGGSFIYQFTPPDAGTYLYHSHAGLQLDRGLYGPLIVEDPAEPLSYDREAVLVFDDWLDGVGGRTPERTLAGLRRRGMPAMPGMSGMSGMNMPGMNGMPGMSDGMSGAGLGVAQMARDLAANRGDSGDVRHPLFLANGRVAAAPPAFDAKPGERVRLRLINAAADTIFAVYVEGHELTVTHADGLAVEHSATDAVVLGAGERYDALVDLRVATRIVGVALGKAGHAAALLRPPGGGRSPKGDAPWRLPGRILDPGLLRAADAAPPSPQADQIAVELNMVADGYGWTLAGRTGPDLVLAELARDADVRFSFRNRTMMPHPMHLHGHFFQVLGRGGAGPMKDTVLVPGMATVDVALRADNPGRWALHCHNAYHQEAGMMAEVRVA